VRRDARALLEDVQNDSPEGASVLVVVVVVVVLAAAATIAVVVVYM